MKNLFPTLSFERTQFINTFFMKSIGLLIFLFIFCSQTYAQNKIKINYSRPPLNELKLSHIWDFELNNLTNEEVNFYLFGSLNEKKAGLIATGTTMTIKLNPKEKRKFKISDLPQTPDISYPNSDPRFKEALVRMGKFPNGDYTVCVIAKESGTNEEISNDECFEQEVEELFEAEISLLSPDNNESFDQSSPIIFSWTPLPIGGPYKIKIVEIKGDESPENAMLKNKAFFEKEEIRSTTFQYPPTGPKFESGKIYAWMVYSSKIKSEIGTFSRIWSDSNNHNPGITNSSERYKCDDFKLKFTENSNPIPVDRNDKTRPISNEKDDCGFDISFTNNFKGSPELNPERLKISVSDFDIISAISSINGLERSPAKIPPHTKSIDWKNTTGYLPSGQINLGTIFFANNISDSFYVVYEFIGKEGRTICRDSILLFTCEDDKCKNDFIRNGGFFQSSIQGVMPSPGTSQFWTSGYGSPNMYFDPNNQNEGFFEAGHIKLSGNSTNGQSVVQALDPNNKILNGKYYKLSIAVKFNSSQNNTNYAKIRVIAFNGSIANAQGIHPPASTNVGIIGRSGKIKDCGTWSIIEFPVWKANKDYSNIAINAFTNDNQIANVEIDNISICESSKEECAELEKDNNGNPVLPQSIGDPPPGFVCQPEAENDDFFNGSLQDLYPGYNGTTDMYSQTGFDNSCFSIGGTIPDDVLNFNCNDSMKAAGTGMTCEEVNALIEQPIQIEEYKIPEFSPIPPLTNLNCDLSKNPNYDNMAFKGRDIIYIHGLQLSHLIDRAGQYPPTIDNWPANKNEIYSGYYRTATYANMFPHIQHFLRNNGSKNRILLVSYNCAEDMETAIHSIMSQIRDAMENGTGVEADRNDPRGTRCFGRDYVFISHSTGALVSDVVLSIANKTKTLGSYQTKYGNVGYMSDRCKGRISIQGAFSGSNLAKLACQIGAVTPTFAGLVLTALSQAPLSNQSIQTLINANPQIIMRSILVDLIPEITRYRWSSLINDITVPVITMAGGHPSAILNFLKYWIHPGFDDGVLDMDCAGGVNNPLSLGPSRFSATGYKVFDMGIPFGRAKKYYLDQTIGSSGSFASAMTPYLSPSGMVQPVQNISVPQNYFNNHFPFIQSAKEHWFNSTEAISGNTPCDYSLSAGAVNNEEMLVVNNSTLFTNGIIDPAIISEMGETVKKLTIWIPWFKWKKWHGIRIPVPYWREFIIWKRTYHKLSDNCQYDVDYAYKYLFRQ